MNRKITLNAPAKLNLVLKITGREPSGLHTLQSLMLPLSLADELSVEILEGQGRLKLACRLSEQLQGHFPDGNTSQAFISELESESNLAYRAAEMFLKANSINHVDLSLALLKRIPPQAGLGGGSADAAAVLRALSQLFPEASAEPIAKALGSDVFPQFVSGVTVVRGTGRSVEKLELIDANLSVLDLEQFSLIVLKPRAGVSTAAAYRALDARRGWLGQGSFGSDNLQICPEISKLVRAMGLGNPLPPDGEREMLTFSLQEGTSALPDSCARGASWSHCFVNDFQDIVVPASDELRFAQELLLKAGALWVLLAGSGSASVGFFGKDSFCKDSFCKDSANASSALKSMAMLRAGVPRGWFLAECGFLVGR